MTNIQGAAVPSGFIKNIKYYSAILLLAAATRVPAATIVWSGASGTDTNWSNGNNWSGNVAPGGGDDAKFYGAGTNAVAGVPTSQVDASFPGYLGSLQF